MQVDRAIDGAMKILTAYLCILAALKELRARRNMYPKTGFLRVRVEVRILTGPTGATGVLDVL